MLTALPGLDVTSVTGEPLRSPPTSASALALPPAQPAYCDERRAKSPPGTSANAAGAATSAARRTVRTSRFVFMGPPEGLIHYGHGGAPRSVGALRAARWGAPAGRYRRCPTAEIHISARSVEHFGAGSGASKERKQRAVM